MRRPRDPPAEPALDRADVDDRLRAAVRVLGIVLPHRDPLEHGIEHVAHANDRVLVPLPLAERRVDERALRRDPQPQRAEVTEDDLRLGRLAEDAHVRDAPVRDEVARAGRVAAVFRSLRRAPLRLFDLAGDRRDHHVTAEPYARVRERTQRLDVAGERTLHVRDPEAVEPTVLHERARLEAGDVPQPRLLARIRRVHVPVEHEARPTSGPDARPEDVRPSVLHLLPLHLEPHVEERLAHELGHRLLRAGEARRARSPEHAHSTSRCSSTRTSVTTRPPRAPGSTDVRDGRSRAPRRATSAARSRAAAGQPRSRPDPSAGARASPCTGG